MLPLVLARRASARLPRSVILPLLLLLGPFGIQSAFAASSGIGPTVREVVEFTRIIQPLNHDDEALQSQVSPDGERAFIVTRQADVRTDMNHFVIRLLDVNPGRLAQGRPHPPTTLLTIESLKDDDDGNPPLREARWADDRTLVFRGRLRDAPFQVYRLDVPTRRLTQLTFEPEGLVNFDLSKDLRRVVYVASVANPPMAAGARSIVAGTNSFWTLHFGQTGMRNQQRRFRYMAAEAGSRQPARSLGESFPESSGGWPRMSISPDGRWAVVPRYEPARQLAWSLQYPQLAEAIERYGPSVKLDPSGYFSRPLAFVARRMVAYRLADGHEQAVVDAPDDFVPGVRIDRLWQGGGSSVVIAGTYLPRGDGESKVDSLSHVIEYWPPSGKWKDIAVLNHRLKTVLPVDDRPDAFVAIDGEQRRRFERGADGTWLEVAEGKLAEGAASSARWQLRVKEGLNEPPDIVAVGPAGANVRLTELNPRFSAATWGTMRTYPWKDAKGRRWNGGLMVPAGFDPTVKHALVIQTYGFSPTRFYRDGANEYDGFTSGFAGRAFLRENILVLALPWSADSGWPDDRHDQLAAFSDGVRGAIESLVAAGYVDRDKIGIMGWSATGERVLNLVTFTDTPIRAATLLDGDANTLFSMTITYAVQDSIQVKKENVNQGGPYGDSLARWIRNDPSLHTDCIKAAMRIETYGPEVHNNWDIYALLRRQYLPVEMIMIPQGAHALSRPSERMISLQGNVDWYRFWLLGEQRSQPFLLSETNATLKDQYARWAQMAALERAAGAKPDCVRAASGGE